MSMFEIYKKGNLLICSNYSILSGSERLMQTIEVLDSNGRRVLPKFIEFYKDKVRTKFYEIKDKCYVFQFLHDNIENETILFIYEVEMENKDMYYLDLTIDQIPVKVLENSKIYNFVNKHNLCLISEPPNGWSRESSFNKFYKVMK